MGSPWQFESRTTVQVSDLSEVFNYGFTTKLGGMGFGLAIAKRIIEENHRGSIAVKSVWGQGTEFRIRLPAGEGYSSLS